MSKKQTFTLKDLQGLTQNDVKLQQVSDKDSIYESSVLMRKTTLGMFPRWVVVADLLDPVRVVDEDIERTTAKLEELKKLREVKLREARTIMAAMPAAYSKKPFSLTGKPSKSKPVSNVFGEDKQDEDKPKTRSVSMKCLPAGPEKVNSNNNQRKH